MHNIGYRDLLDIHIGHALRQGHSWQIPLAHECTYILIPKCECNVSKFQFQGKAEDEDDDSNIVQVFSGYNSVGLYLTKQSPVYIFLMKKWCCILNNWYIGDVPKYISSYIML